MQSQTPSITRLDGRPDPAPRLEALIFDWAGTLVDFGSFAPTQILVEAFGRYDLTLNLEQARSAMGIGKWDHIKAMLALPEVQAQFQALHQRESDDSDVDQIYNTFLPLQTERVGEFSAPIPGVRETLSWARRQGLKIGSCSGYPRIVLDNLLQHANQQQVFVDYHVAFDEVPMARPWPAMALENVIRLEISQVAGCVKIDDTPVGIEEGHGAGMWTVGLLLSGNAAGLTEAEFLA
ncbi:MAG TPA: phosphonoacetaldehyde hydrolase, partial [Alcaligenes sp.]|nr:phosphonoacetaldehyde hydrolase [Alcaligenes sp.]HRL28185.1 phosphonoacetaldehyde hydrolase [Alcaligenes sp.]